MLGMLHMLVPVPIAAPERSAFVTGPTCKPSGSSTVGLACSPHCCAELHFSAVPWPDFGQRELAAALRDYAGRERRFGGRRAASRQSATSGFGACSNLDSSSSGGGSSRSGSHDSRGGGSDWGRGSDVAPRD